MNTDELAIQSAIRDLDAGVYKSQRKAADAHGIARSTLQDRLQGRQSHTIAHQNQQRLSSEQEEFLADWVLDGDSRSRPPSRACVREMAIQILHMNGDYEQLGHLWLSRFLIRNPRAAQVIGRSGKSAKDTTAHHSTVRALLERSACTRVELGITSEDIWNTNELTRVLGDHEWVSIIETISTVGRKIQCLAIFEGVHLQSTWFPALDTPDWLYSTSKSRWITNCIGYEWLRRICIPGSTPKSDRYRLLFSTASDLSTLSSS